MNTILSRSSLLRSGLTGLAAVALLASDGDVIHTSDPAGLAHLVAVLGRQVEVARV